MEIAELKAEKRDGAGKETARKLRAAGKIPAILYGHDDTMMLAVDARDFSALQRGEAGAHVIKLLIAGQKSKPTALIKEIQFDPIRGSYRHIDFQKVAMDEDITASLPIAVVGEAPGIKLGGILEHHLWEVEVQGKPSDLPPNLEADISNLQVGDSLHAKDLVLPSNIALMTDPEELILAIVAPKVEVAATPAEEVEEEEAEVVKEAAEEATPE